MKKLIYFALAAFLLSGFAACTSYDYYTAAINKTNMSSYRTFAWMPPSNNSNDKATGMADIKIKDAATTALVAHGLQVNQTHPDLIVNYKRIVGTGSYTTYYSPNYGGIYPAFGYGYGFGYGWGSWYRPYYAFGGPFDYYGNITYSDKGHFKEGTLIIDLIDPHTRRIVWRGFGVGEVHHDQQKNIDDLPKVVDGVLDQLKLSSEGMKRS